MVFVGHDRRHAWRSVALHLLSAHNTVEVAGNEPRQKIYFSVLITKYLPIESKEGAERYSIENLSVSTRLVTTFRRIVSAHSPR